MTLQIDDRRSRRKVADFPEKILRQIATTLNELDPEPVIRAVDIVRDVRSARSIPIDKAGIRRANPRSLMSRFSSNARARLRDSMTQSRL
jgi:hypothetical protein